MSVIIVCRHTSNELPTISYQLLRLLCLGPQVTINPTCTHPKESEVEHPPQGCLNRCWCDLCSHAMIVHPSGLCPSPWSLVVLDINASRVDTCRFIAVSRNFFWRWLQYFVLLTEGSRQCRWIVCLDFIGHVELSHFLPLRVDVYFH